MRGPRAATPASKTIARCTALRCMSLCAALRSSVLRSNGTAAQCGAEAVGIDFDCVSVASLGTNIDRHKPFHKPETLNRNPQSRRKACCESQVVQLCTACSVAYVRCRGFAPGRHLPLNCKLMNYSGVRCFVCALFGLCVGFGCALALVVLRCLTVAQSMTRRGMSDHVACRQ